LVFNQKRGQNEIGMGRDRPWSLTVAAGQGFAGASRCAGNWDQKWLGANHF